MSDIICVTNRRLCCEDFLTRIDRIAVCSPKYIVLREKDLPEGEYCALAAQAADICRHNGAELILHTYPEAAAESGCRSIHLPMHILRSRPDLSAFTMVGTSCHSPEEAEEAEALGADYIVAGHIFATDCKKGLPPRGLGFLSEVCRRVRVPVYGIGGIAPENIAQVTGAGASGGCIMSGLMSCPPEKIPDIIGK